MADDQAVLAAVDPSAASPKDLTAEAVQAALAADDPIRRQDACTACLQVTSEDPDAGTELVDPLLDALDDESLVVSQRASAALVPVAEAHPLAFEDAGSRLVRLYERDVSTARTYAAKLLSVIAVEEPGVLVSCVPELVQALSADAPGETLDGIEGVDRDTMETIRRHQAADRECEKVARESVANVVVALAEAHPDAVVPVVDDLVALLGDAGPGMMAAVLAALGWVADHDPEAVRPHRAAILDCLDHEDRVVRARSIQALGFLQDTTVIDGLERIAAEDPDEDVRALAAETVDWLARSSDAAVR